MTNILVQNAIIDVAKQIEINNASGGGGVDYNTILGTSLSNYVCGVMYEYYTSGPLYVDSAGGFFICHLSTYENASGFTTNISGSGTSSTDITGLDSIWRNGKVLPTGAAPTFASGEDIIKSITGADGVLEALIQNSPDVERDILIEYAQLKNTICTANTDVHQAWYGGTAQAAQGSPLNRTNLLKVCGTNWNCGEGATCTWTVPSGASRAKFQLWGAGGGGTTGCCCGGAPFNITGAYSEMILDVTPGDTYTVCAGCTCMRSCCSNSEYGKGCMSFVTGNGICCLKADGSNKNDVMCESFNCTRVGVSGGAGSACRRYQNIACTNSGPCWCNYGEYCYNSCATCGVVPTTNACKSNSSAQVVGCVCACDDRNAVHGPKYTHTGLGGGGCLDTNNYGYHIRPPIIDADTGTMFPDSTGCYCLYNNNGSTFGGCDTMGYAHHPGMGGASSFTFGGCNSQKGDYGRGGLVQVSWE